MELHIFNFAKGEDMVAEYENPRVSKHEKTGRKWYNAQLVGGFNRVEQS